MKMPTFILGVILLLSGAFALPPVRVHPPKLVTGKLSLTASIADIADQPSYDITYQGSFHSSETLSGFIALNLFNLAMPSSHVKFSCSTIDITLSLIRVNCLTDETQNISQYSYNYLVFSQEQYNNGILNILCKQETIQLTAPVGQTTFVKIFTLSQELQKGSQYECFVFLRGLEYRSANLNFSVKQSCRQVNRQLQITLLVSQYDLSTELHVSNLIINKRQMVLNRGFTINYHLLTPDSSSFFFDEHITGDLTKEYFLEGIQSIHVRNTSTFQFLKVPSDSSFIYLFDEGSYSAIRVLSLSHVSCPDNYYVDLVKMQCSQDRGGCSQYFQTITLPQSDIKQAHADSSFKIISYNVGNSIEIMRYDGNTWIHFYSLPYSGADQIIKFKFNQDYSRLALLTSQSGLYVYAWDEQKYVEQYSYKGDVLENRDFNDFDVSEDFRTIVMLSKTSVIAINILTTLTFNDKSNTYALKESVVPSSIFRIKLFFYDTMAYMFSNQNIFSMIFSSELGNFILHQQPVAISSSNNGVVENVIDVAMSSLSTTLAVVYSSKLTESNQLRYGVRIIDSKGSLKTIQIMQLISPQEFLPFSNEPHLISLDGMGTHLILKPASGMYQMIFRRGYQDKFQLVEIIGKVPGSSYTTDTINNRALWMSGDSKFILSGNTENSLVMYFCKQNMYKPSKVYEIPRAQKLRKEAPPAPEAPQEENTEEKEELAQKAQQLSSEISSIQAVNIVLLVIGILAILAIILMATYMICVRMRAEKLSSLSTQLDTHNVSKSNIDVEGHNNFGIRE